jgi:hypothetical protein
MRCYSDRAQKYASCGTYVACLPRAARVARVAQRASRAHRVLSLMKEFGVVEERRPAAGKPDSDAGYRLRTDGTGLTAVEARRYVAGVTDQPKTGRQNIPPPDIAERGGTRGGMPQVSDERLFMQFLAFGGARDVGALADAVKRAGIDAVLYEELNDPNGVALLTLHKDPNFFVNTVRPIVSAEPFGRLVPKPAFTMFGRTYAIGYEPDLKETLFDRPRRTVLNPAWPWAVWYPLRRSGRFAQLPAEEQRTILAEHGAIGIAFGAADYAHDIRLACYGLDREDNDFVIGLIGKELYPLSAVVQAMRKTQQTSLYLDRLGPFWIGRAIWQSAIDTGP